MKYHSKTQTDTQRDACSYDFYDRFWLYIDTQREGDNEQAHSFVRSIKAECISIKGLNKTPQGIWAKDNKRPKRRPLKSSIRAICET